MKNRQKKKKLLPAGFKFGWNYGEIFTYSNIVNFCNISNTHTAFLLFFLSKIC